MLIASAVYGDVDDFTTLDKMSQEPLFVSLGSYCDPAHVLRLCNLRKAAFPFDWIISFDGEGLIEMLNDDFREFLKDEYLIPYGPAGHLLNTYYHSEFLHEGAFNGDAFQQNLEKLKIKYQRRIERFRELNEYQGKVFFIRAAYMYSATDPNRYYKFRENLDITEGYSLRLYMALHQRFPNLDFTLVIMNDHNQNGIEERKLSDRLLMFRSNPFSGPMDKIELFKRLVTEVRSQ